MEFRRRPIVQEEKNMRRVSITDAVSRNPGVLPQGAICDVRRVVRVEPRVRAYRGGIVYGGK